MTDRLFFALWPDTALQSVLARRLPPLLDGIQGRAQRPDQWHVTLEFLGAVAIDRQAAVFFIDNPFPTPTRLCSARAWTTNQTGNVRP